MKRTMTTFGILLAALAVAAHADPVAPRKPTPRPQPVGPAPRPVLPRQPVPRPEQPGQPAPRPFQPGPRPVPAPRPVPIPHPLQPLPQGPTFNPFRPGQTNRPLTPPLNRGPWLDPTRHGDGRAFQPPRMLNGRPILARPLQGNGGRFIAPGLNHLGYFDRPDIRQNIRAVQNGWDANNHGYGWHNWNGMNVCHRYDEFGFHWWGFYVGDSYISVRYHNDNFDWYDPYWNRWCSLHDGRWWWQHPATRVIYVYTDGGYYQYSNNNAVVVTVPDTTPPVVVPPNFTPAPPVALVKEVFSVLGDLSIQIQSNGYAYLNDKTLGIRLIDYEVIDATLLYDWMPTNDISRPYMQMVTKIQLTHTDGSVRTFNRRGDPIFGASFHPAASMRTLREKLEHSAAFRSLKNLLD